MRVSLFITCYTDTLFPETGRAVVEVLERLGHTVDFPEAQTCCGQMHVNTGYQKEVLPLVRHFAETFRDARVIVSPSASCVGLVRELYPDLARRTGDDALVAEIEALSPTCFRVFRVFGQGTRRVGCGRVLPTPCHLSSDVSQFTGA